MNTVRLFYDDHRVSGLGRWIQAGGDCVDLVLRGCYNNGTCIAPDTCLCAQGWSGYDCSIPVCLKVITNLKGSFQSLATTTDTHCFHSPANTMATALDLMNVHVSAVGPVIIVRRHYVPKNALIMECVSLLILANVSNGQMTSVTAVSKVLATVLVILPL
jgi:hypothetical protein